MPRLGDEVELLGLFGWEIGYSYSPRLHEAALRATGRDGRYLLWSVSSGDLGDAVRGAYALGVRGANVTTPHKARAAEIAEERSETAGAVGAANVLVRGDGGWIAHNTDVAGFWQPLERRGISPRQALVLGTGGAARAAAVALNQHGASVCVAGRNPASTRRIALDLGATAVRWPMEPGAYDLVVNATPVGRVAGESPVPYGVIAPSAVVYDLVYGAEPTEFLRRAEAIGCTVIGGEEMLLEQAALSWELWFSEQAPRSAMQSALREAMLLE